MLLLISASLLGIIAFVIVSLIIYARWNFGKLEKMGIPVVKPHFLLGSTHDLYKIPAPEQDILWMEQYGGFFGVI